MGTRLVRGQRESTAGVNQFGCWHLPMGPKRRRHRSTPRCSPWQYSNAWGPCESARTALMAGDEQHIWVPLEYLLSAVAAAATKGQGTG